MAPRRDELAALITERGLTRQRVADLTGVSLHTVRSWLRTPGGPGYREMPERALRLLKHELEVAKK